MTESAHIDPRTVQLFEKQGSKILAFNALARAIFCLPGAKGIFRYPLTRRQIDMSGNRPETRPGKIIALK